MPGKRAPDHAKGGGDYDASRSSGSDAEGALHEDRSSGTWFGLSWGLVAWGFLVVMASAGLVERTPFWWLILVFGAAVPVALAVVRAKTTVARAGSKEGELLGVLKERGELTPATAAMRTTLTVDEATRMLEGLTEKGHLKARASSDGSFAYALRERDRRGPPASEMGSESDEAPRPLEALQPLDEPLTERELEVLALLASDRTHREIAQDLFVVVGTVKNHTHNIYRKLGAHNRTEALARSHELDLLK